MSSLGREFRLSLCLQHPTLPASALIEIARRPPRMSYSVGDPRAPAANEPSGERWSHSFCRFRLEVTMTESLDQALLRHASRLRWDAPELARVTHTGGHGYVAVSWLLARSAQCRIESRTHAHLAALNLSLTFDLHYAPG